MHLIYCYIKKFRNIENQEIQFSSDWRVRYDEERLNIYPKEPNPALTFLNNKEIVQDLHLIVGKTGSGKTNLLQLVGMDYYHRCSEWDNDSAYLLLYKMQQSDTFAVESLGLEVEGIPSNVMEAKQFDRNCWSACFNYDFHSNRIQHAKLMGDKDMEDTCIVNAFDRYSFAKCPYDDDKEEAVERTDGWVPRMVSQFGNTRVSMECVALKSYIKHFGSDNVKRKTALQIGWNNWQNKIPLELPKKLLKSDYRSFHEFKRAKEFSKKESPKFRFIHDLMIDFAIYLRKWAALLDPEFPSKYFRFSGGIVDLGISNPRILPDGYKIPIMKRIDWLCQYIDYHTDELFGNRGLVWQIGQDIKDIIDVLKKIDEQYFTENMLTIPVEDIDLTEGGLHQTLFERMDQYRPDQVGVFTHCLLPYSWSHLSSGEYQFAKVWSVLEEYGLHVKLVKKGENFKDAKHPNLIVLLDEPESYMHPEMCRCFISHLYEMMKLRSAHSSLQIILTTHSPFMLSDVLADQVIKMDIDDLGRCLISQNSKPTFAANIHSIMADSFFLNYTIGERAREFLEAKFQLLKSYLNRVDHLSDEEKKEVESMKQFLPQIGDEMIRFSFERLINLLESDRFAVS